MDRTHKELLLGGLVLLVIPLFAEAAMRVAGIRFEPPLYQPDRGRGWTLRPDAQGVVTVETPQRVRINSLGFHDRERQYAKAADTFRIALLGNSWTEALQVPIDKNYGSVLERLLNTRECFAGKHVEVLNFGVAGYSTAQELLLLQQEVWKYHPDLVIVAFYSARDISNNVRELNNTVNSEQSPYFTYDKDGLVLDDSFRGLPALQPNEIKRQNLKTRMTEHVRVLQAINSLQGFTRTQLALAALREKAEKAGVDNLEYSIYSPPAQPSMQKAWRVTEGLFLAVRDAAKAQGASLVIVTLANRPQVLPGVEQRTALENKLGVVDLDYADDRIRQFGTKNGIPVINLAPALSRFAQMNHTYINGFTAANLGTGHWNETGHRLAGETIAEQLCTPANLRAGSHP